MARVDWIAVVYTCVDERARIHLVARYSNRAFARATTRRLLEHCRFWEIPARYFGHTEMWHDGTFEVDVVFDESVTEAQLRAGGVLPITPPF